MTKIDNDTPSTNAMAIVRREYFYLIEHIKLLIDCLKQGDVSFAQVHVMPYGEITDIGVDEVNIELENLTGELAFRRALTHLLDFELQHENQAGVMAKRLPGVICLHHPNETEVIQRITEINRLKKSFEETIKELADGRDAKFALVSQSVPNLIRKAFTRNIMLGQPSYSRVGFSWVRLYSQSKSENKKFWMDKLDNAKSSKANSVNHQDWLTSIKMEKQQLKNANDSEMFKIRRPLRVTPMMNIRDEDKKSRQTTKIAHSPIWFINQDVKVGPFGDYLGQSKALDIPVPVIERLHLYKVEL